MNRIHNATNKGRSRAAWSGYDLERWQWQPSLTAHDPNPPITLEDAAAPATFNAAFAGATHVAGVVCA